MLVDKLDIYGLEMFMVMYCILCISTDMEVANYIVVEVPDNLLLLGAEVPNDTRH
jgi:hypothetical protein